jgi:hypothetical protein
VVVAYDGLPVHRTGRWHAHDAETLLTRWADLPNAVEGQFTALRVDLASEVGAVITDSVGIAPLYHLAQDGGHLVSNSTTVRPAARTGPGRVTVWSSVNSSVREVETLRYCDSSPAPRRPIRWA